MGVYHRPQRAHSQAVAFLQPGNEFVPDWDRVSLLSQGVERDRRLRWGCQQIPSLRWLENIAEAVLGAAGRT